MNRSADRSSGRRRRLALLVSTMGLAGVCMTSAPVFADSMSAPYQKPRLRPAIVSSDLISLTPAEQDSLITKLVAVAGNFEGEMRVDMDVREKAMAIALGLNPTHPEARRAHAELRGGGSRTPVAAYADRATLAQALWQEAGMLLKSGEGAHDLILARVLMELSLTINPDPTNEQLGSYLVAVKAVGGPKVWDGVVQTRDVAGDGASSLRSKIGDIFRAAAEAKRKQQAANTASNFTGSRPGMRPPGTGSTSPGMPGTRPGMTNSQPGAPGATGAPSTPGTTSGTTAGMTAGTTSTGNTAGSTTAGNPAMAANPAADARPISEFKQERADLAFVAGTGGPLGARLGTLTFRVREYDPSEEALIGFFNTETEVASEAFIKSDGDYTLRGLELAEGWVRQRFARWPQNQMIEARANLQTIRMRSGPAMFEPEVSLAGAFALEALFSGMELDKKAVVAGRLNPSGQIETRITNQLAALEKVREAGYSVLVLPKQERVSFRDAYLAGDLEPFLQTQIFEVSNLDEVRAVIRSDKPQQIVEAMRIFSEIQVALADKSLTEMASNKFVQDKLQEVLNLAEGHVSAQMMLAYGQRTGSEKLSATGSLDRVDKILAPLRERFESPVVVEVSTDLETMVTEIERSLRDLGSLIDPQAKPYLDAAVDALQPIEDYLLLNNKETSNGVQKQQAAKEAIGSMIAIRRAMFNRL